MGGVQSYASLAITRGFLRIPKRRLRIYLLNLRTDDARGLYAHLNGAHNTV